MIYVSQRYTRGVSSRPPSLPSYDREVIVGREKNISKAYMKKEREREEQISENNHGKLYRDIFHRSKPVSLIILQQLLIDVFLSKNYLPVSDFVAS